MNRKVLVAVAHPDDEVLGCGAVMARHVLDQDDVKVVVFAEGRLPEPNRAGQKPVRNYADCFEANRRLGVRDVVLLRLPDNKLDSLDLIDIVQRAEKVIHEYKPDLIYTHFANDLNIDHKMVAQAIMTAARPLPGTATREVLFFETVGSTGWDWKHSQDQFQAQIFVDATETWEKKIHALHAYESEMRAYPHARSYDAVEALMRFRGSHVGLPFAEAFMLAWATR
jgi:LmbE family N-acetylglucosaminyl deacetylase